jgi:RIP metalloprotease RseP
VAWPQDGLDSAPPTSSDGEPIGSNHWLRLVALAAGVVALGLVAGISVLAIIGAIAISIFLHELGHFIVAKRAGMKVTEFFIGFGPRIWSFRRGETEYGVKVLPAGAYVRIIGMHNLEQVDPADEARTYRAQPYRKRLPVVLAGPFANFAIALVLLFAIFVGWGTPNLDRWTVDRVVEGSAAAEAGLQPGDRIVSFGGQPVTDFAGLSDMIQPAAGQPVEIVYERDGEEFTTSTVLSWRLSEDAAAALPPLRTGDQVLSVNGDDVGTYENFVTQVNEGDATRATVVFDRSGYRYEAEVATPAELPPAGYSGFLGVGPEVARERLGPVEAVGEAGSSFGEVVRDSVVAIGDRFSPSGIGEYVDTVTSATSSNDAGASAGIRPLDADAAHSVSSAPDPQDENRFLSILGVGRLGSQAFDSGPIAFMWLLVLVNIFLGLFNLVPLPPLDGGHAAIATYEAVREKISGRRYRVDITKLMPVTYAMVFLIVAIGVTSLYLDIVDPVQNPFGP